MSYAGLDFNEELNYFVSQDPQLGDFKVHGKFVTLPTYENLKNDCNFTIMHPLNENYVKPESEFFLTYKKRLVAELNLRLSDLVVDIIHVAAEPELQIKIKDATLIDIISSVKTPDVKSVEDFLKVIKHSTERNDEGFIFDIFLNKNAKSKDKRAANHAAMGRIVFTLYEELTTNETPFGIKIRKKDHHNFIELLRKIFPDIDVKENYTEYTDNQVFRYLTALLKTSYIVAHIIDSLSKTLHTSKIKDLSEMKNIDLSWVKTLPEVYQLVNEIRKIPNQDDTLEDAIKVKSHEPARLKLDESSVSQTPNIQQSQNQSPTYHQETTPQPQTPRQLTAQEILSIPPQQPCVPMYNMPSAPLGYPNVYNQPQVQPPYQQQMAMQPPRQLTAEDILRMPTHMPNAMPVMQQPDLTPTAYYNSNQPPFNPPYTQYPQQQMNMYQQPIYDPIQAQLYSRTYYN